MWDIQGNQPYFNEAPLLAELQIKGDPDNVELKEINEDRAFLNLRRRSQHAR